MRAAREVGGDLAGSVGPNVNEYETRATIRSQPSEGGADAAATTRNDDYPVSEIQSGRAHGTSHANCLAVFLMYLVIATPST